MGESEASEEVCPAEGCADVGSKLWTWMSTKGCTLNGAEVRQLSGGERGVFALEDLPKGHTVLSIPVDLLVTTHRAAATPLGKALLEMHGREPFSDLDGLLLTSWLAYEAGLQNSDWAVYLNSLPSSFPSLGFNYSEEMVRQCAGGLALEEYILSRRGLLDKEFERLSALPEAAGITVEHYRRARFSVFSRTFTLSRMKLNFDVQMNMGKLWTSSSKHGLGGDVGKDEAMAMIPLADMINHVESPSANAKWKYEGMGSGFAIKTKRPIAAGEEFYMSYGDKGNDMFLAHYGFIVPGNRHDKLVVDLLLGEPGEEGASHKLALVGDKPSDV